MCKWRAGCTMISGVVSRSFRKLFISLLALAIAGCAGTQSFHEYARAGDTVAVAAGWKQHFSPDNMTVTVTPASGAPIIYPPNDSSVKGVINLPIDPLSSMVVSRETGIDHTPGARTYSGVVQSNFTSYDKDWWQTVVFIDLPQVLAPGQATIDIVTTDGESASSKVEIIDGAGSPHSFAAELLGPMTAIQRQSLLRVAHYVVSFSGTDVPHTIQLDISHDADIDNSGAGRAHVVNPIGYIKNTAWSDDGFTTRVLLTPVRDTSIERFTDFKFYVTGGLNNLAIAELKAFDSDGLPLSGVSASITYNN